MIWGWPDKQTYVFTSKQVESKQSQITITHDNPVQFMTKMKDRKSDQDIWLLGGTALAKSFAQDGLIDGIILTIISQILGDGIPLGLTFESFDLASERSLMDGITQKPLNVGARSFLSACRGTPSHVCFQRRPFATVHRLLRAKPGISAINVIKFWAVAGAFLFGKTAGYGDH